jgi:hypothetical protein
VSDALDPYLQALAAVLQELLQGTPVMRRELLFPHLPALIELQRMLTDLKDGLPAPKLKSRAMNNPPDSKKRNLQKYILVAGLEAMKARAVMDREETIVRLAERRKIWARGKNPVTASTLNDWGKKFRKHAEFRRWVDRLMGPNRATIEFKIVTWLSHIETAILPGENPGGAKVDY